MSVAEPADPPVVGGVVSTTQCPPVQCSARVASFPVPASVAAPTEVHPDIEVVGHETPCIAAPMAPVGVPIGRTIHFVPFHVSESGFALSYPTATQSVDDGHETAPSSPPPVATFGVGDF